MTNYGVFFEPAGNGIEIQDTNGTVFRKMVTETGYSKNSVLAYAYIGQVDEDYGVHVTYAP